MEDKTRTHFQHSVPVPRIYKTAAKILKLVREGKDSLKTLVYQQKHVNISKLNLLLLETLKREKQIDKLLKDSSLLIHEPRFDPSLAKILLYDLLWGENRLASESKPIQTVLKYEKLLRELVPHINDEPRNIIKCNITKPRYVRVNTLKISVEEAVNSFRDEGWTLATFFNKEDYEGFLTISSNLKDHEFMVDIHIPYLLVFPPKTQFHHHKAYKSGSIILQDKASCIPAQLLNPTPGSEVLDMCAAPGMKTTQIAALVENSGTIYAVERDLRRGKSLEEMVKSSGATCVKTIMVDALTIKSTDYPKVEYVLVDPSCSGSGITGRVEIEELNLKQKGNRLEKLIGFQTKLLRHAFSFKQAKRIVYSTCSMNAEENEDVVRHAIETCNAFKLVDARCMLKPWNNLNSELFPEIGKSCIFASPEKDRTNGFFVAVFERLGEGETNPLLNKELFNLYYGRQGIFKLNKYPVQRHRGAFSKSNRHSNTLNDGNDATVENDSNLSLKRKNIKRKVDLDNAGDDERSDNRTKNEKSNRDEYDEKSNLESWDAENINKNPRKRHRKEDNKNFDCIEDVQVEGNKKANDISSEKTLQKKKKKSKSLDETRDTLMNHTTEFNTENEISIDSSNEQDSKLSKKKKRKKNEASEMVLNLPNEDYKATPTKKNLSLSSEINKNENSKNFLNADSPKSLKKKKHEKAIARDELNEIVIDLSIGDDLVTPSEKKTKKNTKSNDYIEVNENNLESSMKKKHKKSITLDEINEVVVDLLIEDDAATPTKKKSKKKTKSNEDIEENLNNTLNTESSKRKKHKKNNSLEMKINLSNENDAASPTKKKVILTNDSNEGSIKKTKNKNKVSL